MRIGFRITNWLALAFFGFATVFLALSHSSSIVPGAANLLPYGAALIAMRQDTRRWFSWAALALNALWSIVLLGAVAVVLLGYGDSLIAVPFLLVFAAPCTLNIFVLLQSLRAGSNYSSKTDASGAA